jgi:hypothetical protein
MLGYQYILRPSLFFKSHGIHLFSNMPVRYLCADTRPALNTPEDMKKFIAVTYKLADIPELLMYAQELEKAQKLGQAESIYFKIIQTDPTQKEYYNNLLRVQGKRGVFSFSSLDFVLNQYKKHVLKNEEVADEKKESFIEINSTIRNKP